MDAVVRRRTSARSRKRARDGKLRVDARDVLDRLRLEVEHGGVLAEVRDLQDAAGAAVVDQEGLVALAAEVAGAARDSRTARRRSRATSSAREPRRRRLEHARGGDGWRCRQSSGARTIAGEDYGGAC